MSPDPVSWLRCLGTRLDNIRESRRTKLGIVFLALLLDSLLLTVVVPIIPDYLLVLQTAAEEDFYYNNSSLYYNHTHIRYWLVNASDASSSPWQQEPTNETTIHFGLDRDGYLDEVGEVGWLFSSKAIVQLITNPFVGPITNRYGYSITMFAGFVVLVSSTMLYAFGESFAILCLARAIHGVGSSCTAIAGMTMLAHIYQEDEDRSKAMGIAMGGLALGVLIGYPFGGIMYQFVGKMAPFVIIAACILVIGALQLWALKPSKEMERLSAGSRDETAGTSLLVLLKDPYILLASGALLFPEMAMAVLESTLPIWLIGTMQPPRWQLGVVFVPDSLGYFVGCNVFGYLALRLGRWRVTIVGLLMMGVCLVCVPMATHIYHLIIPHLGIGLSLGMVDAAVMPLLAHLVDTRHVAVYGSVYAIGQVAISMGFAVGPSLGGQAVKIIGFAWLMRGVAILNLVFSPLCWFLRSPPAREENKSILTENGLVTYGGEEGTFSYQQLQEE